MRLAQRSLAALLTAALLLAVACRGSKSPAADQLRTCINSNQPHARWTTWAGTLNEDRSKYKVQGIWWSQQPSSNSQLTLLTHMTLEQKWQLKALCSSWQGPLSVVIHVPTVKPKAPGPPAPPGSNNTNTTTNVSFAPTSPEEATLGASTQAATPVLEATATAAGSTAGTGATVEPGGTVEPGAVVEPGATAGETAITAAGTGQAAAAGLPAAAVQAQGGNKPAAAGTAAGSAAATPEEAGALKQIDSPAASGSAGAEAAGLAGNSPGAAAGLLHSSPGAGAAGAGAGVAAVAQGSDPATGDAGAIKAGDAAGAVARRARGLLAAHHSRHSTDIRGTDQWRRSVLQASPETTVAGVAGVAGVAADAAVAGITAAVAGTAGGGLEHDPANAGIAPGASLDSSGAPLPASAALPHQHRATGAAHGRGEHGGAHAGQGSRAGAASGGSGKPADGIAGVVNEARAHAQAVHTSLERLNACQADIMLVQETYQEDAAVGDRALSMYPGPAMQNYARLQARTPFVAYVDVDMVVSGNLFAEAQHLNATRYDERNNMRDSDSTAQQAAGKEGGVPRLAWVLPAFVVSGTRRKDEMKEADRLAASGAKQELLAALQRTEVATGGRRDKHEVLLARLDRLLASHLPTNYDRWLETDAPYRVMYDEGYEPFVIVDRLGAAWADHRFRGYLRGRSALALALVAQGYHLVVHPRAYLIHRPHPTGVGLQRYAREIEAEAARQQAAQQRRVEWERHEGAPSTLRLSWYRQSMLSHDSALLTVVSGAAEQGVYRPVVDVSVLACLGELPWWGPQAARYNQARAYQMGKVWAVSDWDMEGGAQLTHHARNQTAGESDGGAGEDGGLEAKGDAGEEPGTGGQEGEGDLQGEGDKGEGGEKGKDTDEGQPADGDSAGPDDESRATKGDD